MPVSSNKGKQYIRRWFRENGEDLDVILDLGPGEGTYPKKFSKYTSAEWYAVEIWAPYVERFSLQDKYTGVFIGDIRYVDYKSLPIPHLHNVDKTSCVIAGDVLEHLPRQDAANMFGDLYNMFDHVIISTPIHSDSKTVWEGNWFEKHQTVWTWEELKKIAHQYPIKKLDDKLAVFIK